VLEIDQQHKNIAILNDNSILCAIYMVQICYKMIAYTREEQTTNSKVEMTKYVN
jgi:hypothetical protein